MTTATGLPALPGEDAAFLAAALDALDSADDPAPVWDGRRRFVPTDEIVMRYEAGESCEQIAEAYGVGADTIRKRLEEAGVERRGPGAPRKQVPTDEIVTRYEAGASCEQIAEAYGVAGSTVRQRLEEAGVARRSQAEAARKVLPVAEIVTRYQAGETIRQLATAYQVDDKTIGQRLDEAGVSRRAGAVVRKVLPVTEIAARYQAGATIAELAAAYQVGDRTIRRRLKEAGVI